MFKNKINSIYKNIIYILEKLFWLCKNIKTLNNINTFIKDFIFRYIFKKKIEWNIAYTRTSWKKSFSKNKIKIIPNPKNRWFADPFVEKKGSSYYVFFEDFSLIKNKGSISCIKIDKKNKIKYFKEIIDENFHLSFPFIFKHNKCLFMTPESCDDKSVRLYKCVKFPNKWKFIKKIIKNVELVDPIVFKQDDRWILLASKKKIKSIYTRLCLYTSKNPLSSSWKSLKSNPVVDSSILGRNAGLIKESYKNIYRISQAQLPGNYGAFISINKILNISKRNFFEKRIKNILPSHDKHIEGIHTLNYAKNFTVFDCSKWKK